jgi:hypothetical protein
MQNEFSVADETVKEIDESSNDLLCENFEEPQNFHEDAGNPDFGMMYNELSVDEDTIMKTKKQPNERLDPYCDELVMAFKALLECKDEIKEQMNRTSHIFCENFEQSHKKDCPLGKWKYCATGTILVAATAIVGSYIFCKFRRTH